MEEVRALFQDELLGKRQSITEPLPRWEEVACEEEAEERVIKTFWSIQEDPLAFAFYNHLIRKPKFGSLLRRLYEPLHGMISDERIKARFTSESGVWSPTMLEEYAECPYRYFSDKVLRLESQTEGIDIRRRGTILHDVLEDFFRWRHSEKERHVSFEEAEDRCLKKFDELWNQEPLAGDRYYKIELERKKMQKMITEILKKELVKKRPPIPGLMPAYFEYVFNDLVLKGENRQILLRGKIDRIDVDAAEKYALVIDYKTGKRFQAKYLENGTSLQLPFYLIAVREKLGLKPLGGHLYSLKEAASSGFHHLDHMNEAHLATQKKNHLSDKEFEELLKRSVRFAEKFVEEIERGDIPVRPRNCASYCPYSAVCRIEKWRLKHIYHEIEKEDRDQIQGRIQETGAEI